MNVVNAVLRGLFDVLLAPFRGLPALVGLTLLALVTGVAILLVYKVASDQKGLEAVKRKIHASLFEIRLFNDDFRHIVRAQLDILRHNLTYLRLSFVPFLFLLPPLFLMLAQLQFHYGYAPLAPGARTLLEVELAEGWEEEWEAMGLELHASGKPRLELEAPPGVEVETAPVWVPSERTLTWRLQVTERGDHELTLAAGGERWTKSLRTDGRWVRRSPLRPDRSFVDQLLFPAEPPLPAAGPLHQIRLELPPAEIDVFGWTWREWAGVPAWMLLYFLLSVVFAFALRKPLGVEI